MSAPAHKPRVLIVDDEQRLLRAFDRFFHNGWDVVLEHDPNHALATLLDPLELFDCIFLDIVMPDLNGFNLFEELKSRARNRTKRIIFITAAPEIPAVQAFFETHKVLWMEKPFNHPRMEALVAMLATSSLPKGP
jgi:DNA-binding response OmpR family regulator